jgi:hypothetical protein
MMTTMMAHHLVEEAEDGGPGREERERRPHVGQEGALVGKREPVVGLLADVAQTPVVMAGDA